MSRLYSRDRKTQTIRWGYRIDQSRSLEKSITEGEPQLLDFSPIHIALKSYGTRSALPLYWCHKGVYQQTRRSQTDLCLRHHLLSPLWTTMLPCAQSRHAGYGRWAGRRWRLLLRKRLCKLIRSGLWWLMCTNRWTNRLYCRHSSGHWGSGYLKEHRRRA